MAGLLRTTLFLTKGLREFTRGGYERASKGFDNTAMNKPASLLDRRCMGEYKCSFPHSARSYS
jgi:hypothetical protein